MQKIPIYLLPRFTSCKPCSITLSSFSDRSLVKWVSLAEEEITILSIFFFEKISHDNKTYLFPTNKK